MKKLTTDELVSYIENEGKKKEKLSREEASDLANAALSTESNKMQAVRAKAKALVENKKATTTVSNPISQS
jgi:hypothetical protein